MKGTLLAIGGGLLLWWYMKQQGINLFGSTTTTIPTGTTTPPVSTGTTTGSTGTTTSTTPTNAFNTLASIYSRISHAAPTNSQFTADQWNFYLAQQSNIVPPDPAVVFPTQDRSALMTLPTYWGTMSSYLMTNQGLSGIASLAGLAGGWAA